MGYLKPTLKPETSFDAWCEANYGYTPMREDLMRQPVPDVSTKRKSHTKPANPLRFDYASMDGVRGQRPRPRGHRHG